MNLPSTESSNKVKLLFALAFALCFSCDSPLSDVEITDPGLLQTNFVVERALLNDGTVLGGLQATIFDKNLASVELKNGNIKVNDQQTSMTEILNIKTYYIPSASVNLDTDYNFQMNLADGKSYNGTVKTPAKTFTSLTVQSNPNVNEDLVISWSDIYVHDDLIITLNLTSPAGTVPGATFNLTTEQMQAGTFTIPKSSFATPAGITSVMITLTGVEYGTIDSKFKSGSGTISRMRIEKNVSFK
jgi:hypothetical protein